MRPLLSFWFSLPDSSNACSKVMGSVVLGTGMPAFSNTDLLTNMARSLLQSLGSP